MLPIYYELHALLSNITATGSRAISSASRGLTLASLKVTPGVGSADDIVEGAPDDGFESDQQSIDDDDFDSSGDDAINKPSGESVSPTKLM